MEDWKATQMTESLLSLVYRNGILELYTMCSNIGLSSHITHVHKNNIHEVSTIHYSFLFYFSSGINTEP